MIFKRSSIICLLFALGGLGHAAEYTMADLEALESEKNIEEFFRHAKDVRPSQRQAAWNKMVLSMGDLYAQELLKANSISSAQFSHFASISMWSALHEDEFFAQKRNKVSQSYFKKCLKTKGVKCFKDMRQFFSSVKQDPVLGFELAKIASSIKGERLELWAFMSPIAQSPFGEFYCDKSPLYEALAFKISSQEELSSHKDCVKSFVHRAQKEIKSANDLEAKTLAYRSLASLGLLSPEDKNKQSIYDALAGALVKREHWSDALKALSFYSESKAQREGLIEDLNKHETFPDDLFSMKSSKQALALTKLMGKKFPELIDLYANKCLNWLRGKGDFPSGNPTPNCHSYFEMAKVIGSSPSGIIQEYDQLVGSLKN